MVPDSAPLILIISRICVCDIPSKFEDLKRAYAGAFPAFFMFRRSDHAQDTPGVTVLPNGYAVSRCSDFIIYSVEAELIDRVVKEYGPCESARPRHVDSTLKSSSHKAKRRRCWPDLRKNT